MSDEPEQQQPSETDGGVQDTTIDKQCSECGAPVDDIRVTCPKCGTEYKPEDHEHKGMGHEFTAGTAVDEDGKEIPDHPTGN